MREGALPKAAAVSPWRRPEFRWFFVGQGVSLFGGAMSSVALPIAVLLASGSLRDLSLVAAANSIPMLLFLLVGGAVADRFPRSAVLILAHLGAAATQTVVATLLLTGAYHLGALIAMSALNGMFTAFTSPALRGILPQLVDRAALQRANAARATSRNIAKIAGPTAAGLLTAAASGGWAIAFDAASFLVAAFCLTRLRLPAAEPATPGGGRPPVLADLREGWTAFRSLRWVVVLATIFAVTNIIWVGIWFVLGPKLTLQTGGKAAWGLVTSARAVGLLVLGAIMYRLATGRLLQLGQACAALVAIPLVMFGLHVPIGWLIAAALVAGAGSSVLGIAWETSLQEHVRPELLSRVASYDELTSFIGVPVGQLAVVPAAAAFGDRRVAIVGGLLYLVVILSAFLSPSVRNLRHGIHRPDAAIHETTTATGANV